MQGVEFSVLLKNSAAKIKLSLLLKIALQLELPTICCAGIWKCAHRIVYIISKKYNTLCVQALVKPIIYTNLCFYYFWFTLWNTPFKRVFSSSRLSTKYLFSMLQLFQVTSAPIVIKKMWWVRSCSFFSASEIAFKWLTVLFENEIASLYEKTWMEGGQHVFLAAYSIKSCNKWN